MYEAIESATILDQQNGEYAEAAVLPEGASGAPENIDVDASVHPEDSKDQYV